MKKLNFKWLAVLCLAMGFATVAKAQINEDEICFYAEAGTSNVRFVVKFDYSNDRVLIRGTKFAPYEPVRSNLKKSENFYENENWSESNQSGKRIQMYKYDSRRSTSKREVYKRKESRAGNQIIQWAGGTPVYNSIPGYRYVAFSTDAEVSSFKMWFEDDNNYDGEINGLQQYTRVPKKDLLPKAVTDDFLND